MQYPYWNMRNEFNEPIYYPWTYSTLYRQPIPLMDYGPKPLIIDIEEVTLQNNNFRTVLWTGTHLQLTLMDIPVGDDIGVEMHPNVDQFLRIEHGHALVKMGGSKESLTFEQAITEDYAIIVPAGTWHNVVNIGHVPLKIYSIYAPPQHKFGTIQPTKQDALHEDHH